MPQISIIVPVYKVEQYLDRCVNSILNQTFTDFELILVDDGSPDRCPQMCDEWAKKDARIHVIHKENGGLSSARNAGLAVMQGEYVNFVDSDDWIEHHMLERLFTLLKEHPESQIAQCGARRTKGEEEIKEAKNSPQIRVLDQKGMLDYFFRVNGEESNTGVWNKLIKVEILNGFEFVDTLNEDVEASYEFFTRAKLMVVTDEKMYNYFINQSGITNSKFREKDFDYLAVWERVCNRTKKEHPEYAAYAEINRKRANFTLLSKMMLCGYDKTNLHIVERRKKMKQQLRKDFWQLLRWKMPLTRKMLLVILTITK